MPKKPAKNVTPIPSAVLLSDVRPSANNPRKFTDENIAKVAESIRKFGWAQAMLADHKGQLVIGHLRYQAALKLLADKTPIYNWPDNRKALIGFLPKGYPRKYMEALKIADNRLSAEATFDLDQLAVNLKEFGLENFFTGFSADESAKIFQVSHELRALTGRCSEENRRPSTAPVSYYGGKKTLSAVIAEIASCIHYTRYIEPFSGGAAIAFSPVTAKINDIILNDINREIINFWQHIADPALHKKLVALVEKRGIVHEEFFQQANAIYRAPAKASPLERAWALFYTLTNSMFSAAGASFSVGKNRGPGFAAKVRKLTAAHQASMKKWMFLTRDASIVLRRYADPHTLIYADPPYVATSTTEVNQGHYAGFSDADFQKVLDELANTSAKFILSSYENAALTNAIRKNGWHKLVIRTTSSSAAAGVTSAAKGKVSIKSIIPEDIGLRIMRYEWIVTNFPIPAHLTKKTPKAKAGKKK